MPKKKRSVTIQDVAKTAGVSVSTVSRVLNGKVDVASDTQDRVLSVIDHMGYASNLAARSMRSRRMNLIGLIMPDIAYPFAFEVMRGVNQVISETEFDLMVFTTGNVRKIGTASQEQKYVSLLNNSLTDGVILVAPVSSEFSTAGPIVSIDSVASNPDHPTVHATNHRGATEVVEYLIGLGHRRIAHISGRPELESSVRREKGYREALQKAGIPVDERLIAAGDFTTVTGIECARTLLSLDEPPTAIFASNDQMAMGVYQVAQERGIRIPEDLSLAGFDNIADSRYLGLTTVDQFISELGVVAVKMLIRLINGETLETPVYKMQTQLVVRSSCRRPD